MNTKLTAIALTAATALSFAPKPAYAGDKEWAAVGGLIGGLIIGSAISEARHHDAPRTTTVIVRDNDRCDDGYWREVQVRTWVDGCWETRYDCGRRVRIFTPGHYVYRTDRVWVSCDRHDHRHVSYGYGHRR